MTDRRTEEERYMEEVSGRMVKVAIFIWAVLAVCSIPLCLAAGGLGGM